MDILIGLIVIISCITIYSFIVAIGAALIYKYISEGMLGLFLIMSWAYFLLYLTGLMIAR